MSEVSVTGVEGLDVRVPQVELFWEILSFTHACFGFATLPSHPPVSFPASSGQQDPTGYCTQQRALQKGERGTAAGQSTRGSSSR